jgi:hypothetical protein
MCMQSVVVVVVAAQTVVDVAPVVPLEHGGNRLLICS